MKIKLLFGLGSIVAFSLYFLSRPTQIRPYPYYFQENPPIEFEKTPPLAIVGDRLAEKFQEFIPLMQEEISINLKHPIQIVTFGKKTFALHRTLNQIKRMKTLPKVILYLGGSEEFFENKYQMSEVASVRRNFLRYKDTTYQSILYIAPSFSKFLYEKIGPVVLGPSVTKINENILFDGVHSEVEYLHYEMALDELIKYVKSRNSLFVAITTPLNLSAPPGAACSFVESQEITAQLNQVRDLINKNDFKGAYGLINNLKEISAANAKYYYLKGIIERKLALFKPARESLIKSVAFDCSKYRGDPVFNQILKKVAGQHQVFLFDFEKLIYADWGENVLFFDEIYPQNFYFQRSARALAKVIKKLLKL